MFHLFFRDLPQKYGPVMLITFGIDIVVISSKEAAGEYLERCDPPETVASSGEEWETSKYIALIKLFNTKNQSFRFIKEEDNDLLVKKLSEYASRLSPVNLTKTLSTLVSNSGEISESASLSMMTASGNL